MCFTVFLFDFISLLPTFLFFSFSNINSLAEFLMLVAEFPINFLMNVTCLYNLWSYWLLFQMKLFNCSSTHFYSFEISNWGVTHIWVSFAACFFVYSSGFFLATWGTAGFIPLPFLFEDLPNEHPTLRSSIPTTAYPTALCWGSFLLQPLGSWNCKACSPWAINFLFLQFSAIPSFIL